LINEIISGYHHELILTGEEEFKGSRKMEGVF
jgi:hypothetical protein